MNESSSGSIRTFTLYQTALAAIRAGISFIPILADGTKSPAIRWKDFQQKLPTVRDAKTWFSGKNRGIAFITGQVSGGLEMLDFDAHGIYERFAERMHQEGFAALLERIEQGYKELSPKGIHLYYRCSSAVEGNKKIAQRLIQGPPYALSLIETRGEGGYSIGAPSSGAVHPSGRPYRVQSGSLETIQRIQPEDRLLLLSVARTLDEVPLVGRPVSRSRADVQQNAGKRLPGTIFNERATWPEILEPHGWIRVRSIGKEDFWRRPGKEWGISATTNYEGSDYLYVFSTSTLFESRVGISKFAAYTFLEHAGDFSAATKALVAQGYVEDDRQPSVRECSP
ncbi:bifunctional DNA primase/polymerase [Tengunoibacter tsumagoiensis]|uniref:DNA primase/polymerase bifunctional N-terminal domain-containing protein n=1 Tax=Tengunoibacter tsumagoiensis TaxID=2014871 RepID=A0A402A7U1_9CHLR|nr:bifunctional DNA primase/polymerase [Tengunoibacter tsumagoiensis]GCE15066.1 hypothetical protein KTT_49250 [Tengunoibacter tsumagoiensis]